MKVVVADASPFVGLIKIGHVDILPGLFTTIIIPPEVLSDLSKPTQAKEVLEFAGTPPVWLVIQAATTTEFIPDIDPGERAAINLAKELQADLLLIDERKGREAAIARGLATARTAAVMFDAANAGVLPDLRSAYEKLKKTNFRVPAAVLDDLLARHESQKQR